MSDVEPVEEPVEEPAPSVEELPARPVPAAEILDDLRAKGSVSAAVADLVADDTLTAKDLDREIGRVQAEAALSALAAIEDDPEQGPVGEIHLEVGGLTSVRLTNKSVDADGVLEFNIEHPDIASVYPDGVLVNPIRVFNPPTMVDTGRTEMVPNPYADIPGRPAMVSQPVFEENPEEAVKQMVDRIVKGLPR